MNADGGALGNASPAPAWYGKLPGMGDFAHRRMPAHFLSIWDPWLQAGLHGLRSRHPDWVDRYLRGPLWCFALGQGVAGPPPWAGIMMPSVDGAGRYFPLTVATELAGAATPAFSAAPACCLRLWNLSTAAAIEALEQDLDAEQFEAGLLRRCAGAAAVAPAQEPLAVQWPPANQSSWFQSPIQSHNGDFVTTGLPQGAAFDALFGFVQDSALKVSGVTR